MEELRPINTIKKTFNEILEKYNELNETEFPNYEDFGVYVAGIIEAHRKWDKWESEYKESINPF